MVVLPTNELLCEKPPPKAVRRSCAGLAADSFLLSQSQNGMSSDAKKQTRTLDRGIHAGLTLQALQRRLKPPFRRLEGSLKGLTLKVPFKSGGTGPSTLSLKGSGPIQDFVPLDWRNQEMQIATLSLPCISNVLLFVYSELNDYDSTLSETFNAWLELFVPCTQPAAAAKPLLKRSAGFDMILLTQTSV
eukprot:s2722_g5.t1